MKLTEKEKAQFLEQLESANAMIIFTAKIPENETPTNPSDVFVVFEGDAAHLDRLLKSAFNFDRLHGRSEFINMVVRAINDVRSGRFVAKPEIISSIQEKYYNGRTKRNQ